MTPAAPPTRPYRVLFVEHNVDGTVGGSHRCLLDICRNLDRSRYAPLALFFQDNSLVSEFRGSGIEIAIGSPARLLVEWPRLTTSWGSWLFTQLKSVVNAGLLLLVRPLLWARFLRAHRIDIVHLNNSFNGDHDLILAAWMLHLPCVAHQRGVAEPSGATEHWFARRLSRIIAISSFVRDDLLRRGLPEALITFVHDGIDPRRIHIDVPTAELRRRVGFAPDDTVIGIVGNLKHWKGQHVFVDAMSLITSKHSGVRGLIVGAPADTRYVKELQETVERYGLRPNIVFTGYQQHPLDYMALMDVVVHASVEPEPFGIVITEAMALGKPVVATAIGGPLDIVVDGLTGYLTPAGDAEKLADTVLQLLDNPASLQRMGSAASRRFEEQFTVARNVTAIERIYCEVLPPR